MFVPTENAERAEIAGRPNLKKMVADYKGREEMSAGEAFEATPENIQRRTKTGEFAIRGQVRTVAERNTRRRSHRRG